MAGKGRSFFHDYPGSCQRMNWKFMDETGKVCNLKIQDRFAAPKAKSYQQVGMSL